MSLTVDRILSAIVLRPSNFIVIHDGQVPSRRCNMTGHGNLFDKFAKPSTVLVDGGSRFVKGKLGYITFSLI